jgi:hypothetical protein
MPCIRFRAGAPSDDWEGPSGDPFRDDEDEDEDEEGEENGDSGTRESPVPAWPPPLPRLKGPRCPRCYGLLPAHAQVCPTLYPHGYAPIPPPTHHHAAPYPCPPPHMAHPHMVPPPHMAPPPQPQYPPPWMHPHPPPVMVHPPCQHCGVPHNGYCAAMHAAEAQMLSAAGHGPTAHPAQGQPQADRVALGQRRPLPPDARQGASKRPRQNL